MVPALRLRVAGVRDGGVGFAVAGIGESAAVVSAASLAADERVTLWDICKFP